MFPKKFGKRIVKIFSVWSSIFLAVPMQSFGALPASAAVISTPTAGSLVINEIMKDPIIVPDVRGEWFELYNPTDTDINLSGLTISGGAQSFTISSGIISAKGFFVLGKWAQKESPGGNGGVDLNYVYGGAFILNNNEPDEITLKHNSILIDTVTYDDGITFPDLTGKSMILSDPGSDNSIGGNWCGSTSAYGDGNNMGTPGRQNDPCVIPEKKITICHFPSGPQSVPESIEINETSWTEHEAHGDTQGACPEFGKISGCKFIDQNGNGAREQEEATQEGWTIEARQGETLVSSAVTDVAGCYSLINFVPGDYIVSEVQKEGFTQTFPQGGSYNITISANQEILNLDFGNHPINVCGNFEREGDEQCDLGTQNGVECAAGYGESCNFCSNKCDIVEKRGEFCGDGARNGPEQCDGLDGVTEGKQCNSSCTLEDIIIPPVPPECGDNAVNQPSEECDTGSNNGTACTPEYGTACSYCSGDCKNIVVAAPSCPDGVKNGAEECDTLDGITPGTMCSPECTLVPITGSVCGEKFYDHNGNGAKDFDDENLSGWEISLSPKLECAEGDIWGDSWQNFRQGKRNDGTSVLPENSAPDSVLGAPEGTADARTYLSLGFGGEITVRFENLIENLPGEDVQISEATLNREAYPEERAQIYASQDSIHWEFLGNASSQSNNAFDLGTLAWAQYVKIIDTTSPTLHDGEADGFDVDALSALHCVRLGESEAVETGETGYCFENVALGKYHVAEMLEGGWINTTAVGEQVEITSTETRATVSFGNQPDQRVLPGAICGFKFEDVNGNARWDASEGERGLGSWKIRATNGAVTYETVTSSGSENLGEYCFFGITPGTWSVSEVLQDGWISTTGASLKAVIGLVEGSINNNFGNFKLGKISGFKYEDMLADGKVDPDDLTIFGWKIFLTRTGENSTTTATTTNEFGMYAFENVGPGTYEVTEETLAGWGKTFPTSTEPIQVMMLSGMEAGQINFLNAKIPETEPQTPEPPPPPPPAAGGGGGGLGLSLHTQTAGEINEETSGSVIISWFTNIPSTSRVLYDIVSHPDAELGPPPNYGYAWSSPLQDTAPRATYHSVRIDGLLGGTTYYFRSVSSASPEKLGKETFFTLKESSPEKIPEIQGEAPKLPAVNAEEGASPEETSGPEFGIGGETPRIGDILGTEYAEEATTTEEEAADEPYALSTATATTTPQIFNKGWRILFWFVLILILFWLFFLWYGKKGDGTTSGGASPGKTEPEIKSENEIDPRTFLDTS